MTDQEFMAWVRGYCYAKQGEGYGDGTPPDGFAPIIAVYKNEDGTLDRSRMLEMLNVSAAMKGTLEKV